MRQMVSLREINQHLARYVHAVEEGEEIIITRRGVPVAKLTSMPAKVSLTPAQREAWQRTVQRMKKGVSLSKAHYTRTQLHER